MKIIAKTLLLALCMLPLSQAHALGAVSRACQFSSIPENQKALAAAFFQAVGAPYEYWDMAFRPIEKQKEYWILESLTIDWLQVRYYLYAHSDVYADVGGNRWQWLSSRPSESWTAKAIPDVMKNDPRFRIYYHNRGILYSARAGMPQILEHVSVGNPRGVIGGHAYYDPVSKRIVLMNDTIAVDCNLKNFGQEGQGLFDR